MKNKYKGNIEFFEELKKRGLVGYDATSTSIQKYAGKMSMFHTPELAIFNGKYLKHTIDINLVEKYINNINNE